MSAELLDLAIATAGGQELWNTLRGLKADVRRPEVLGQRSP
jgi:hypothetical protein